MTNLRTLIRSVMDERGLTYRSIAQRAAEHGHRISHATVANYVNGRTRTYTRESLTAIAAGLGISEQRLLDAAGLSALGEPFELPDEAALLEPHEREAVRSVVQAFIQNKQRQDEEVGDHAQRSAPMNQAGGQPAPGHAGEYGLAAHPDDDAIGDDQLPDEGP